MAVLLNPTLWLENFQHYGSCLPKVKGLTLAPPAPLQQCLYPRLSQSDTQGRLGLQQRAWGSWGCLEPIGGKGLGHSCGFLASSGPRQWHELNTVSGPWGDDIIWDWKVSKTNSLTLPSETCVLHNALFCLIQLSGFVCEFCSSLC